MSFTKEQTKEAYKKLLPEVQDFVMDNETTDLIAQYLKEAGLSEDQAAEADSEILYAMLGLQTFEVARNNIAKISGKSAEDLRDLKKKLDENIFNKIPRSKVSQPQTQLQPPKPNSIGNSFEQAIVNQARAMQPAVAPQEQSSGEAKPAREAPSNLPTDNTNKVVHNYKQGEDPYREPPV